MMNMMNSRSGAPPNPARILNMALSQQRQQQMNFRAHQERYLGNNPNRQPSEDDLFEMASMLMDDPAQPNNLQSTSWNGLGSDMGSMMGVNRVITPSNSSMMQQLNGFMPRGSPQAFLSNGGMMPQQQQIGNSYTQQPQMVQQRSSPTNVSDSDLFDDDELDMVLGGESEGGLPQKKEAPRNNNSKPKAPKNQPGTLLEPPTTVTPETSQRDAHSSTKNRSALTDNMLPEKTLEEMLRQSSSSKKKQSASDEENQDEWCLIDFGDDDVEAPGSCKLTKRKSFEDLLPDDENDAPKNKKKKNQS